MVDVDLPPMNNMHVLFEPREEPGYDIEIDQISKVLDGVHDYILVPDINHRSTNPLERYG